MPDTSSRSDPASPSPSRKDGAAVGKVLVVEDDAAIRDALAEALTDEGFPVEIARDGAEAFELIDEDRPALVLLDLMMPRMTGWQVIQEMRKRPDLRSVPLFVITAAGNAGTVPTGYPVFVKPLSVDRLVVAIRRMLTARTGSA